MTDSTDKMTIKELADELGITKNTVRNYLVKAGYDLARYKKNGIIMLDKELIGVVRSIYHFRFCYQSIICFFHFAGIQSKTKNRNIDFC